MDSRTLEQQHTSGFYAKRDITIVRGLGAHLWDDQGNEYIDCVGGYGVANIGHCNPAVVAAIREQAERLITCPELFYNDMRAQAMDRLVPGSGGLDRVVLTNSAPSRSSGARWRACRRPAGHCGHHAGLSRTHDGCARPRGMATTVTPSCRSCPVSATCPTATSRPCAARSTRTPPQSSSRLCRARAASTRAAASICRLCAPSATSAAPC